MSPILLIPSRLAAIRLPNKPLALIRGKPLIQHVWERAIAADVARVVVSCCSEDIKKVIEDAGGEAVLTSPDLPSGTDRVAAALQHLDPTHQHDIVINLQGDLPTIEPDDIRRVLKPFEDTRNFDISTLATPTKTEDEKTNINVVKAVIGNIRDTVGQAFYFSRSPLPSGHNTYYHHMGIYAFRRSVLEDIVNRSPSPLEQQERLEQLRALEVGYTFGVAITDALPLGVDTPEDLKIAESRLS